MPFGFLESGVTVLTGDGRGWGADTVHTITSFCFAQWGKHPAASAGDPEVRVLFPGWEAPLGKEMATHCSILAGRSPWTEEPGGYSLCGGTDSDTTEAT